VTGHYSYVPIPPSAAYRHVEQRMSEGCAILDGGVATELDRVRRESRLDAPRPWGTWALYEAHAHTLEVHRRFVEAGCDVISTNTWSILDVAHLRTGQLSPADRGLPHWTDIARTAVRLARLAIADAGRQDSCAVAFCIDGDFTRGSAPGALELLETAWQNDPPDLVVLETLGEVTTEALAVVADIRDTGLPVWLSLQVGREHIASDEALPGLLASLDDRALDALLLNCLDPTELSGAIRLLSEISEIPLGVYPRIGRQGAAAWESDPGIGPHEFGDWARAFHREGACIFGGCCGVTPEHLGAAARALGAHAAEELPLLRP
jgi:5-methyltetrahydrofolate--homocysteine methyltransferase